MSRPMKFDKDQAIEMIVEEMWQAGYEACSVKSLADKLNITRSSFYNTFGSRENMFRTVLDEYTSRPQNNAIYFISRDRAFKPNVTEFFSELCRIRTKDMQHRGCLFINCIAELLPATENDDAGQFVLQRSVQARQALEARILLAIQDGEFSQDTDASHLACALTSLINGTNLLSKTVHDEGVLWAQCELTLKGLRCFEEGG